MSSFSSPLPVGVLVGLPSVFLLVYHVVCRSEISQRRHCCIGKTARHGAVLACHDDTAGKASREQEGTTFVAALVGETQHPVLRVARRLTLSGNIRL